MENNVTTVSPADTMGETSTAPVASFRYGNVSAAIFGQDRKTKNGKPFTAFSVSLRRVYVDADGKPAFAQSLNREDLLFASHALLKCFETLHGTDVSSSKR